MYAADRDRERATAALREHYARGRLTVDELTARVGHALTARSRPELRDALVGLPAPLDPREIAARGQVLAHTVARGAVLFVFTGAYLVFSFVLLLVLGLTLVIQGASGWTLVGFLLVWLVPTYLLARLWRRKPQR